MGEGGGGGLGVLADADPPALRLIAAPVDLARPAGGFVIPMTKIEEQVVTPAFGCPKQSPKLSDGLSHAPVGAFFVGLWE